MMPGEQAIVAVGFLSIVVGVPLAGRRVRPNHWYGLRVPATFADRRIWYAANERCGDDLVLLGLVILVVALGLPAAFTLSPPLYAAACTVVAAGGAAACVTRAWRYANRLRREIEERPGRDES